MIGAVVPSGVVLAGYLLIGSLICNRVTDLLRKLDPHNTWPKALWILTPWAAGIVLAVLVCNLDAFRTVAGLPADFATCSGVLLTGLGLGSLAGFWHEVMDFFGSRAKEARADAAAKTP